MTAINVNFSHRLATPAIETEMDLLDCVTLACNRVASTLRALAQSDPNNPDDMRDALFAASIGVEDIEEIVRAWVTRSTAAEMAIRRHR